MWKPAMDSCLEPWKGAIEPWIMEFWVGFQRLGLGFKNTKQRRRREEKKNEKWRNPGRSPFYTRVGSGWPKTRSTLLSFSAVDQDPDGSGSIQRSWGVSLIRIHQIRGFGPLTRQLLFFFQFLDFFSLFTPLFLLSEPLCMLKFLAKFLENS